MAFEQTEGVFDFGLLPSNFHADVQVFGPGGNVGSMQRWIKPRGISMVYVMCLQSGGGGGGGLSGASTTARGGGGGGACGGMATLIKPAIFIPDTLQVLVAMGGKGASGTGVAGGNGANSIVSLGGGLTGATVVPNILLQSGVTVPGGGGAGTNAAGGAAGTVPTIAVASTIGHSAALGSFLALVGLVGIIGGAQTGAVGGNITAGWNLIPTTPGASGAGVNTVSTGFAGGSVTIQAALDHPDGSVPATAIAGGTAGSAAAAGNGNPGYQLWKPFVGTGGSGGGSSDGSTGGAGGNGALGCGGGGGGGGVTGGAGGNGGDGLVVIISW